MTTATLLSLLLLFPVQDPPAKPAQPSQERESKGDKRPKRGDVVVGRGCLRGSVLESASLAAPDGSDLQTELITYRLTGDRKTIEAIRKDHDRHADVVTGELRTDLPTSTATPGKKIGNTRIVVGAGPSRPMMPDGPPPMPVLKVTSFEHTGVPCR